MSGDSFPFFLSDLILPSGDMPFWHRRVSERGVAFRGRQGAPKPAARPSETQNCSQSGDHHSHNLGWEIQDMRCMGQGLCIAHPAKRGYDISTGSHSSTLQEIISSSTPASSIVVFPALFADTVPKE